MRCPTDILDRVKRCDGGGCVCKDGVIKYFRGRPYCAEKTKSKQIRQTALQILGIQGLFSNYDAVKRLLHNPKRLKTLGVGVLYGVLSAQLSRFIRELCLKKLRTGSLQVMQTWQSISLKNDVQTILNANAATIKVALGLSLMGASEEEVFRVTLPKYLHDLAKQKLGDTPTAENFANFVRIVIPSVTFGLSHLYNLALPGAEKKK